MTGKISDPKEKDLSGIKFVISDWDGTLADSWSEATASFTHIMSEKFGIDPKVAKSYYDQTAGRALSGQIKDAAKKFANIVIDDTLELESMYWDYRKNLPAPKVITGAFEVLKELKEKGFMVVVWSGTRKDALDDAIEKTGLAPFIAFSIGNVSGSNVLVKGKGLFAEIARHFGILPEDLQKQAVVIGDGRGDVEAGREVGCPTVGVIKTTSGEKLKEAGADFVISDISELPKLLN